MPKIVLCWKVCLIFNVKNVTILNTPTNVGVLGMKCNCKSVACFATDIVWISSSGYYTKQVSAIPFYKGNPKSLLLFSTPTSKAI